MNTTAPLSSVVLKTRQQAPNGVTFTKLHVTKQTQLNYNFGLFQKWNFQPVNRESPDQH